MKYQPSTINGRGLSSVPDRLRSFIAVVSLFASIACSVPAFAQIVGSSHLNVERRGHSATLLEDGKVLIVGGENQSGMVGQAELFDPASRASTVSATSINARTDHTATKVADGRVLVIGGRDQSGLLSSSEIYNPVTASFTAGPSMLTARGGHTATVLSDGRILVAGGDAAGSSEIFNPATESFSPVAGNMNTGRKFHSAILTNSGQVLIVGGVNAEGAVLNTAEVFDPASQTFYLEKETTFLPF